jgi:hypothetical protein
VLDCLCLKQFVAGAVISSVRVPLNRIWFFLLLCISEQAIQNEATIVRTVCLSVCLSDYLILEYFKRFLVTYPIPVLSGELNP